MYPFIRNLAGQQDLVMVSINYRLGILGWFHHPALGFPGMSEAPGNKMLATPAIFRDGAVIPKDDPNELFKDPARYNAVPFIAGNNRDEMRLFNLTDPELTDMRLGFISSIRDQAAFDRASRYGSDNWISAATDEPLTVMAAAGRRHDVFGYRFA